MADPASVGHVGVTVPDVDAAVEWYSRALGWTLLMGPVDVTVADPRVAHQIRDVFEADDVAFRQAHMSTGGGVAVELFQFERPRPTNDRGDYDYWRVGYFHICLVDPDIEARAARIVEFGGVHRTPVRPIFPDEPYLFCYCEDPYGNVIELATHPHEDSFGGRRGY